MGFSAKLFIRCLRMVPLKFKDFKGGFFAIAALFLVSGCSLEASIIKEEILPVRNIEFLQANQTELLHGEVVTVYAGSRGYQIRAVFGELAEETPSINGSPWVVEGVFYE